MWHRPWLELADKLLSDPLFDSAKTTFFLRRRLNRDFSAYSVENGIFTPCPAGFRRIEPLQRGLNRVPNLA
ncbi:hypothetical protein CJ178_07320 [Rhodococcus sp. ACPA4]|nr:hypothetical protein CJ178_07320 [Rhodococcus sp. ACPA4]